MRHLLGLLLVTLLAACETPLQPAPSPDVLKRARSAYEVCGIKQLMNLSGGIVNETAMELATIAEAPCHEQRAAVKEAYAAEAVHKTPPALVSRSVDIYMAAVRKNTITWLASEVLQARAEAARAVQGKQ